MSHMAQWMTHCAHPGMVNSLCTCFSFSAIKAPGLALPCLQKCPLFSSMLCCFNIHACFSLSHELWADLLWNLPYPYLHLSDKMLRPKTSYLNWMHLFFLCIILWTLTLQAYTFSKSVTLLTQSLKFIVCLSP